MSWNVVWGLYSEPQAVGPLHHAQTIYKVHLKIEIGRCGCIKRTTNSFVTSSLGINAQKSISLWKLICCSMTSNQIVSLSNAKYFKLLGGLYKRLKQWLFSKCYVWRCRIKNIAITKKMLFARHIQRYYRDPLIKMSEFLQTPIDQVKNMTQSKGQFAKLDSSDPRGGTWYMHIRGGKTIFLC